MMKRLGVIAFVLGSLFATSTQAGIAPSPFKWRELPGVVERIGQRLDVVATWREVPPELLRQTIALQARLVELKGTITEDRYVKLKVAGNIVAIMDTITVVMLESQSEAPAVASALNVLDRLSGRLLDPQPELPQETLKALGIMDRIASRAFNPQPEPPGRTLGISILEKITQVAFDPQPESPGRQATVLDALDAASAVMFDQPEPMHPGTITTMVDAIVQMGQLAGR
jgi:hypothetical protein